MVSAEKIARVPSFRNVGVGHAGQPRRCADKIHDFLRSYLHDSYQRLATGRLKAWRNIGTDDTIKRLPRRVPQRSALEVRERADAPGKVGMPNARTSVCSPCPA